MTYAAVPQMHQTGKKSPAEAGPRALAEGGSLDFRNGTIPQRGDWFHQEQPRHARGFLCLSTDRPVFGSRFPFRGGRFQARRAADHSVTEILHRTSFLKTSVLLLHNCPNLSS